jgi:L-malate glycosyltransferase
MSTLFQESGISFHGDESARTFVGLEIYFVGLCDLSGIDGKVLFLASWFPSQNDPLSGVFIKKHAEAVLKYCEIVVLTVIFVEEPSAPKYRLEVREEDGTPVARVFVNKFAGNPGISRFVNMWRYFNGCRVGYGNLTLSYGKPIMAHVNVAIPVGIFALALKWFGKIPYVITEHHSIYSAYDGRYAISSWFNRWVTRRVFRNAAAVSAVSRFLLDALRGHDLVRCLNVQIPNVVDIPEALDRKEPDARRLKLLSVSLLSDRDKNITGMLRAFRSVREKHPEAELHVVGSGQDFGKIEDLARELGLLGRCVFLKGYVPNFEIHKEFLDASFFVLNSNYETFSVATAEAIAHGVPVVVTKCGGPEEYVTSEIGILVERQNEESLAQGMINMIENFRTYDPMKLRQYAKERFGEEYVGRILFGFYNMLPGTHGRLGERQ